MTGHLTDRPSHGWTEARIEALKKLWSEGYSASQIAEKLRGVSRCAVIGKVQRLRLPPRHPEVKRANSSAAQRARQAMLRTASGKPSAPKVSAPRPSLAIAGNGAVFEKAQAREAQAPPIDKLAWAPLPGVTPVSIVDLCSSHCRWPLEIAADFPHACGAPVAGDGPYCQAHGQRARGVQKSTPKELIRSLRRFAA